MLGAAGGMLGALGAHAAIGLTHLNFSMEGVSIEVVASNAATLAGVLLATALGAVAGVVPAISAARREIVQGFRAA